MPGLLDTGELHIFELHKGRLASLVVLRHLPAVPVSVRKQREKLTQENRFECLVILTGLEDARRGGDVLYMLLVNEAAVVAFLLVVVVGEARELSDMRVLLPRRNHCSRRDRHAVVRHGKWIA